jgi:hypothetical protein
MARNAMAGAAKIGKTGPHTMPPKTVDTQPSPGTVGIKPFEAGGDQMGEVPHFANNVGKSMGKAGGMTKHWSGR